MKTSQMNNGTRDRRTIKSGDLAERFNSNPTLGNKFVIHDDKDFMLEVPTNILKQQGLF